MYHSLAALCEAVTFTAQYNAHEPENVCIAAVARWELSVQAVAALDSSFAKFIFQLVERCL